MCCLCLLNSHITTWCCVLVYLGVNSCACFSIRRTAIRTVRYCAKTIDAKCNQLIAVDICVVLRCAVCAYRAIVIHRYAQFYVFAIIKVHIAWGAEWKVKMFLCSTLGSHEPIFATIWCSASNSHASNWKSLQWTYAVMSRVCEIAIELRGYSNECYLMCAATT